MATVVVLLAVGLQLVMSFKRDVSLDTDEVQFEEKMPETIWIGSRFGLIPYDIDWLYYNKSLLSGFKGQIGQEFLLLHDLTSTDITFTTGLSEIS